MAVEIYGPVMGASCLSYGGGDDALLSRPRRWVLPKGEESMEGGVRHAREETVTLITQM